MLEHVQKQAAQPDRESGWTLLEITISLTVLTIGIISFLMSLTSSMRLGAAGHERDMAMNAARQVIEEMREQTFEEVFALYNHDVNDDPAGVGTAPGPHFDVTGLNPLSSDADGHVGEIEFPVSGGSLVEDITDAQLGMPMDLNGDAGVDSNDHYGDYIILPVTVRIHWEGVGGDWLVEMRSLLTERY